MNSYSYFASFLVGYNFNIIQDIIGMRNLWDGVDYYSEVHLSFWNSLIHTMFMPLTMLGMYLWIPALFDLDNVHAQIMKDMAMIFYIGLYMKISLTITCLVCMLYYFPYVYSSFLYSKEVFKLGLICSIVSLFIQEVLGHYIGGDAPSRMEAVPNAILYAPFYSVSHFTTFVFNSGDLFS